MQISFQKAELSQSSEQRILEAYRRIRMSRLVRV